MVHDLDETIKERNIKKMIAHKLGTNTIKFNIKFNEPEYTIVSLDVPEFCIHVTNIPNDVNSDELSTIFKVDIVNILVQPHNELNDHLVENSRIQVEAWIKEIDNEQSTQKLAKEKHGLYLRGFRIQCQDICVTLEIFELCEHFQNETCSYSICCDMKHIQCVEPSTCGNIQRWYGHDSQRTTRSERRSISSEDGYRVRIANFPLKATREEIFKHLPSKFPRIRENLILYNESNPTKLIIAYVIDQKSEIIAKRLIHSWHNQQFLQDQPSKMKCQLEINVENFNSTIGFLMSMAP
ncbi:unnamed protein product [Rotaria sordida]|uniref:Uncharacterized protein n=2 Tax=Rotaria sordida TaxID=392033 RepID=A0A819D5I1_9BILA|nr:unnamed protein product [Rotaria sordida]CAF3831013.1 unnamed protein product [Rotaria sordida]